VLRGFFLAALLLPAGLWGQALSQGTTQKGLAWAVVELPAGESEFFGLWLPPEVAPPAGWKPVPSFWGSLALLEAPALTCLPQFLAGLEGVGEAVAAVWVGPLPRRELAGPLAALEALRPVFPPRPSCDFLDGLVTVERSTQEGFQLSFPLPGPLSPTWELGELAAGVVDKRWKALGFSGPVRWQQGPCPLLVLEDRGGLPQERLARAREQLAKLAAAPQPQELAAYAQWKQREASRWAVAPQEVALAALPRLGWGLPLGSLFHPLTPSPQALESFLAQALLQQRGSAVLWRRERRLGPPERQVLPSGVTLEVQESWGEVAILAVAFSGLVGHRAGQMAQQLALAASREGWPAEVLETAGMAAVAVAAPADQVPEVLETWVAALAAVPPAPEENLQDKALQAFGLALRPQGENLAVFLWVPEGEEEAVEAAQKFLAALQPGPLRQDRPPAPGLQVLASQGPVQEVAVVRLPDSLLAAVLGELLLQRLQGQGVQAQLQHVPGSLLLAFGAEGGENLRELEGKLEKAWEEARLLPASQLLQAWQIQVQGRGGSAAQQALRRALALFLPALAQPGTPPEAAEAEQVLAYLPSFRELPRLGQGPLGEEPRTGPRRR